MTDSELDQLMGACYHEDFEDLWSGVDEYRVDIVDSEIAALVSEIDELLARTADPGFNLRARLRDLGSYVHLGDEDPPYADWVGGIRRRCVRHLARATAPREGPATS